MEGARSDSAPLAEIWPAYSKAPVDGWTPLKPAHFIPPLWLPLTPVTLTSQILWPSRLRLGALARLVFDRGGTNRYLGHLVLRGGIKLKVPALLPSPKPMISECFWSPTLRHPQFKGPVS
jgi:hypothetical protein